MEIKCDKCGTVHDTVEPKTVWDGDIGHMFFRCPDCRAVFPIAATDKKLRADISEYQHRRNHIRISPVTEKFLRDTEALKQENLKRCRELMEQHPLALFLEAHPDIIKAMDREDEK